MAQSISNLYTAPKFKTQTSTAAVAKPSPLQWTPIPGAKANAYTGTGGLLNLTGSPTTATPSATTTPDPLKLTVGQTAPNLSNNFSINQGGILRNAPAPVASAPAAPSGNPPTGSMVSTGTPFAPTNTGVNGLTGTTFDQNGTVLNQGTQTPSSTGGVAPSSSISAPGLIELLTKYAQGQGTQNPAIVQAQQDLLDTQNKIASLRQNAATAQGNEAQYDPSAINYKTGVQAELQNQEAAKETALQGQAQAQQSYAGNLLTAQQAGQTGINNALSAALTTTQAPYGTPLYQPGTGSFVNSGGAGGSFGGALEDYAQRLASNSMAPSQIPSDVTSNPVLYNQLLKRAQELNPSFNVTQAEANKSAQSASILQTGTTGGNLQKSADSTNRALDTLSNVFNQLGTAQKGGIPLTNSIANWIAGAFGQQTLTQYKAALEDARAQLQGVLTSSGAATPTGAEAAALKYLPDDMTPQQFQQLIGTPEQPGTVRQLVSQKVSAFTQSGQQNGSNTTTGNNLYAF